MNEPKILVIDDEDQIVKLLQITLRSNGYTVYDAGTAKSGISMAASYSPDLILLDIGLPDKNGHGVLAELRTWYAKPIIILSVQNNETDIVGALDNGANDYLVKPFRTGELLARIRSAIRRSEATDKEPVFVFEDLSIDMVARVVKKKNEIIKLTATEYSLLSLFVKNEGKVLTHSYILKEVWGNAYASETQYLRVFIARLRKKIEDNPKKPKFLITLPTAGYKFIK